LVTGLEWEALEKAVAEATEIEAVTRLANANEGGVVDIRWPVSLN
jgi:hypothetical protein